MFRFLLLMMLLSAQYQNKRVLTLFTDDAANPAYLHQLSLLSADEPGLHERDVVIEKITRSNANSGRFKAEKIKAPFTIILTGKDGGEKYRSTQPINLKTLYAIIDAMPMRQDEMRRKGN